MTAPEVDDYAAFARSIGFRFLRPADPLSHRWHLAIYYYHRLGGTFDYFNLRLPFGENRLRRTLAPLKKVPRMSTAAIACLINRGVATMRPGEAFVNVGVWNGFTFLSGLAGNPDKPCVGVDDFSQFEAPREAFLARFNRFKSPAHAFYDLDYRDYFARIHRGPIGFYLYDGEHSYQNQLHGLTVAEPFFGPRCVVMVDDTNLTEARQATLDFMARSPHRWQVLLDVHTARNGHPTWWNGILLLRRQG